MAIRKWMVVVSLALVAVMALTVASIGSAKPEANAAIKVAVVTDIGGLNDKGFNSLAYKGLKDAQKSLGVKGRVFISKSPQDYIPNLSTAAKDGYDLVIAVGFLMSDSTAAVAKRFPKTKFAIVDVSAPSMKGKPKNVDQVPMLGKVEALLADAKRPWAYAHNTARQMFKVARVEWLDSDQLHKLVAALQIDSQRQRRRSSSSMET